MPIENRTESFNDILYEIHERIYKIKMPYSIANLLLKAYFFTWISHKTLFCCAQLLKFKISTNSLMTWTLFAFPGVPISI